MPTSRATCAVERCCAGSGRTHTSTVAYAERCASCALRAHTRKVGSARAACPPTRGGNRRPIVDARCSGGCAAGGTAKRYSMSRSSPGLRLLSPRRRRPSAGGRLCASPATCAPYRPAPGIGSRRRSPRSTAPNIPGLWPVLPDRSASPASRSRPSRTVPAWYGSWSHGSSAGIATKSIWPTRTRAYGSPIRAVSSTSCRRQSASRTLSVTTAAPWRYQPDFPAGRRFDADLPERRVASAP